ncbi:MAG: LamG-like jellyroll fold domain-containing protein, partial [Steroidobacter sp.]
MTVEAWVLPKATEWGAGISKLVENDGTPPAYELSATGTPGWFNWQIGAVRIADESNAAQANGGLAVNVWTHLATTYDGSAIRLYVNGALAASQSVNGAIRTGTAALTFSGVNVVLDELRIYNRALSAAEITADMDNPIGVSDGDAQSPTAPTGVAASVISSTQINLSWTASTDDVGVTDYFVERCQGAGCTNFTQIATLTNTSYSDTGRTASTSYNYRVRATDAASNLSLYSST